MNRSCYQPFFRKNQHGQERLVPCGRCPKCRARIVSGWSVRLLQELKVSKSAKFITLTYADENLPISRNGYRSLYRRDLQLFFKRLRQLNKRAANRNHIKYFAVGEYGGKIGRPHYHVILFNSRIECIQKAWRQAVYVHSDGLPIARTIGNNGQITKVRCRRGKIKTKKMDIGHIHYGDQRGVTGASIGYCLKYILKPKDETGCPDDDSVKPFRLISTELGISYVKDASWRKWHHADINNRMYVTVDNKKVSMPRYWKEKLYTDKQREEIANHSRNKFAEDILKDLFKEYATSNAETYYQKGQSKKHSQEQAMKAAYRKQHSSNKKLCYVL